MLWDRLKNSAEPAAACLLALSILVGKLKLPLGRFGIESSPWLDIRLISLLIALVLFAPTLKNFDFRRVMVPALLAVVAFAIYMVGRTFFDQSVVGLSKQIDMIYLVIHAVMICIVVSLQRTRAIFGMALVAFAAVYLFANLADRVLHFTGPAENVGLGWGPIGTAVTFNRLMFVGCCLSFVFAFTSKTLRWPALILASLFLFGGLASLQKTAAGFYLISLAVAAVVVVYAKAWRMFVLSGLAIAAAVALFVPTYGPHFLSRVAETVTSETFEGATGTKPAETTPSPFGSDYRYVPRFDLTYKITDRPTQYAVQTSYCLFERNVSEGGVLEPVCRDSRVVDRTSRPVLFSEAAKDFAEHPIVGKGMGNYEVLMINEEYLWPDRYYYPHNVFFEAASEGGVIGLVLLGLSFLILAIQAFRSSAPLPVVSFVGALAFFMFLACQFAGDFYDTRLLWLSALGLAAWAPGTTTNGGPR